jgi:hypothetical protein
VPTNPPLTEPERQRIREAEYRAVYRERYGVYPGEKPSK